MPLNSAIDHKPDLTAHFSSDQRVVARQDLHNDPVPGKRLQRGCGGFLGGIEKGDITFQCQFALVGYVICCFQRMKRARCNSQYP